MRFKPIGVDNLLEVNSVVKDHGKKAGDVQFSSRNLGEGAY